MQRNGVARYQALAVFLVSMLIVVLELLHTRMLNLKTWNHVVYVVIPLSMLGYGIGANVHLFSKRWLQRYAPEKVTSVVMALVAMAALGSSVALVHLPVRLEDMLGLMDGQLGLLSA